MTEENDLPDDVALLWGLRDAPRRGRKPSLTTADITRAAIGVADAEGLAAVSMARVAQQLDKSTMALYRHVRSKDELLALMVDAAMEEPPELPPGRDWRAGLTTWSHGVLAVHRKHPWLSRVPISGPPTGPHNLAWFDRALAALAGTPLAEDEKVGVVMGLLTFVNGEVRLAGDLAAGYQDNPEAFSRAYSNALKRVVDPRRLPWLSKVVEAGVFDLDDLHAEEDLEADFTFGLNIFLDGVAAHVARLA
ncbi:TetR/AcrR family transcriptional regulator [Saccharothrix xinjiangensis]|uniref:TetR/AcrR family transcriptional regulator n=1 Tax=Saccharothrix xinjiangensis TaxID=204798 RepID=A0ABV9YE83_9PSEU